MNKIVGIISVIIVMVWLSVELFFPLYQSYNARKDAYLLIREAELSLENRTLTLPVKNGKTVRAFRDNVYLRVGGLRTYSLDTFCSEIVKGAEKGDLFVIFWLSTDVVFDLIQHPDLIWLNWHTTYPRKPIISKDCRWENAWEYAQPKLHSS